MNNPIPITENIFWIGVNDYVTDLFEALWPLPYGVSYNSYFIKDEKTTLIDTVKEQFLNKYLENLLKLLQNKPLDYLIINHMEPDHSGVIKILTKVFPNLQIIGNTKTADLLKHFYDIERNIKIVQDKEELDLGSHKLQIHFTPMLHWPETIMTYEKTSKILFSGDAFGSFGGIQGDISDDNLDTDFFEEEARRYFSNVFGKYSANVQKTLTSIQNLDINVLASTHGPIFKKNPQYVLKLYDRWSKYETEEGVVIVYASMYGNTQKMAEETAQALAAEKIRRIKIFNISHTHVSFILNEIWKYKGLILATPTYDTKLFPLITNLMTLLENKLIKNHIVGIILSYSWEGSSIEILKDAAKRCNWQLIEPYVQVKCSPSSEDLRKCNLLGQNMAKYLRSSE